MENVYQGGDADARQGDDEQVKLFRPRYRKLSDEEVALHDEIKGKAEELAELFAKIDTTPRATVPHPSEDVVTHMALNRGANISLAVRHLEDAVYRAVKGLTG